MVVETFLVLNVLRPNERNKQKPDNDGWGAISLCRENALPIAWCRTQGAETQD